MTDRSEPIYYTLLWKNLETGATKIGSKKFVAYNQKTIDDHIFSLNLGTGDHIEYKAEIVSPEAA